MHPEWYSFLEQAGAHIADGAVRDFGGAAHERKAVGTEALLADLSHFTPIRIHGADAEKFLQGQLTSDVRLLDDKRSQLAAYCSPKGRALAVTRLFRSGERYHCALPAALVEPSLNRLRKYVLMSKVVFEVADGEVHIGYADPHGDARLHAALGAAPPTEPEAVIHVDEVSVVRVRDAAARYELFGPVARMRELWQRLAAHATPAGAGAWEALEIAAGLPCVYPETADAFVPQMLNLDLLGGISFKKGCYTGQEVVARTHYLGKLKRRMYRLHCADAVPPAPGTPLFGSALRADESAGSVVRAAAAAGGSTLLAVLQMDAVDGELRLGELGGPRCDVVPLPYPLDAPAG